MAPNKVIFDNNIFINIAPRAMLETLPMRRYNPMTHEYLVAEAPSAKSLGVSFTRRSTLSETVVL
jgi:hypothetical protein